MNPSGTWNKYLLALLPVFAAVFLIAVRGQGESRSWSGSSSSAPAHSMVDVYRARYASILIYDGNGGVSSFMVGGGTSAFSSLAGGIEAARPAGGQPDASFSDLIVFSFSSAETVEFPYSSARNQFTAQGQVFSPGSDLAPLINNVAKKLT